MQDAANSGSQEATESTQARICQKRVALELIGHIQGQLKPIFEVAIALVPDNLPSNPAVFNCQLFYSNELNQLAGYLSELGYRATAIELKNQSDRIFELWKGPGKLNDPEALHRDIKGSFTRSLAELEAESVESVELEHELERRARLAYDLVSTMCRLLRGIEKTLNNEVGPVRAEDLFDEVARMLPTQVDDLELGNHIVATQNTAPKTPPALLVGRVDANDKNAELKDPVALIKVVAIVGRDAGRSDKLADKLRRRGGAVVKLAGKLHAERRDVITFLPIKHKAAIEQL